MYKYSRNCRLSLFMVCVLSIGWFNRISELTFPLWTPLLSICVPFPLLVLYILCMGFFALSEFERKSGSDSISIVLGNPASCTLTRGGSATYALTRPSCPASFIKLSMALFPICASFKIWVRKKRTRWKIFGCISERDFKKRTEILSVWNGSRGL